jgi:hypothetical protein
MYQSETKTIKVADLLGKIQSVDQLPVFVQRDVQALKKHITNMGLPPEVSAHELKIRMHQYFGSKSLNKKKDYSASYTNNLWCSIAKIVFGDEASVQSPVDPISMKWEAQKAAVDLNVFPGDFQMTQFGYGWVYFVKFVTVRKITPEEFTLAYWLEFKAHLRAIPWLNPHTTCHGYIQSLNKALRSLGFPTDMTKKKPVFAASIEQQIDELRIYATTPRDGLDAIDNEDPDSLSPGYTRPNTFKTIEYMLRKFLDFHRDKIVADANISQFLTSKHLNEYLKASIRQNLFTAETVKAKIYNVAILGKYLRRLGNPVFADLSVDDFLKWDQDLKKLLRMMASATKESVAQKIDGNPLPSYPSFYLKMSDYVERKWKEILKAEKELALKPPSPWRNEQIRKLAFEVQSLVEILYISHFSPRPEDLYKNMVVTEIRDLDGEVIPPCVRFSEYNSYHIFHFPRKTQRRDKTQRMKFNTPAVYFQWHRRWQDILDAYLKKYRAIIHPTSHLFLPGDIETIKDQSDRLMGARTGARYSRFLKMSRKILGVDLSANDFRKMYISFLDAIGLGEFEGRLVGHNHGKKVSAVAGKNYIQKDPYLINLHAETFYSVFDKAIAEEAVKLKHNWVPYKKVV